jgi:conserved oligomeric Golgi complex subunit 3
MGGSVVYNNPTGHVVSNLKMTSTRVPPRRIQTQTLAPTPSKPTISVEEWEAKAPLLDSAMKSINIIKAASENRPLPLKVSLELVTHGCMIYQPNAKFFPDDVLSSRPSTPTIRKPGGPSSRPGTPNTLTSATTRVNAALHVLHPKQPIQTPQQFYDWFTLIDQSVARSQESHFHTHLETVTNDVEMCDRVLERIELLEREVADMTEGWRGVEEGGKSLKDACERLLIEKVSLSSPHDVEVGSHLLTLL